MYGTNHNNYQINSVNTNPNGGGVQGYAPQQIYNGNNQQSTTPYQQSQQKQTQQIQQIYPSQSTFPRSQGGFSNNNVYPSQYSSPTAPIQSNYTSPPIQKYSYTGNVGSNSPRIPTTTAPSQQAYSIIQPQSFNPSSQQKYQQSSLPINPTTINQYNQNQQQSPQDLSNSNYIDSFSGSMLDEGVSSNGGLKLMPESRQIQGSKPDAFCKAQNVGISSGGVQGNSQMNDLSYQLNQIRIATLKQKDVQEPVGDPSAFKIVNKDTGEVFDIRQFDGEQKKSGRSPLHSNTNYHPPQQQIQQTTFSTQAQYSQQQPSQFQSHQQPPNGQNINNSGSAWSEWWNKKRKNNNDLLQYSKLNNTAQCLELLDKKLGDMRADVNVKDSANEWTPLHYSCQNGNSKLVSQLLYHEATIDAESQQLQTPLIIAAIGGYDDILQLLITAGADINFQDINGNTALHHGCLNGNKKIVEILLKKPSLDYKCLNKNNKEPYELCKDDEIKKSFDNFFVFQKAMMKKNPKVRIFNANADTVTQMFHSNQNIQQQQQQPPFTQKQPSLGQQQSSDGQHQSNSQQSTPPTLSANSSTKQSENKSSFNNSDVDTSNLSDEEKIGPNSFIVHGLIGKGSFGEVYLVEKKDSQQLYAMKVLHKSKIMRHNLTRYALTERNVLSVTKHPFIVRLNYAFQTPDKLFLILKYCPGGDLGEHLQKEKRFTEERVRNYLAEITLALEHLHKKDVIFRDLKPDNIVLDHEGHAMLTDFGLSKEGVLDHSTGAKSFCGSVAYLAPEMLKRCGHGKAVDWYLLGVVMYELLVGIPPYYANNKEELFNNIEKGHLKLPSFLTGDARSLLKALLQRNPVKRLGSGKGDADEIKAHPFFSCINWEEAEQRKLSVQIPNRKIRISTKFDPNVFEPSSFVENGKEYIPGWSFVDHNSDQINQNLGNNSNNKQ